MRSEEPAGQLKFDLFEREVISPLAGLTLTPLEKRVANLLLDATAARPMGISEVLAKLGPVDSLRVRTDAREVKRIVRSLRREHALPILARRKKPAGYFWCQSVEEMREFITSFRSQAMDELVTLAKIVKANYPELAGQLTIEDVREEEGK